MTSKKKKTLDETDRGILNLIQAGFPLAPRPYAVLAEELGLAEEEVLGRVESMKKGGVIRRMGASIDLRKIGYVSTLCAARVPEERLPAFVERVNAEAGVTHNYRRSHEYNVWFTLIAESRERLLEILDNIRRDTSVADLAELPSRRQFKVRVDLAV